jgi:hypothetical protein
MKYKTIFNKDVGGRLNESNKLIACKVQNTLKDSTGELIPKQRILIGWCLPRRI